MHLLPGAVVDVLPWRLWHPGNLHLGSSLHFCSDGRRTIEWKGRVVAEGRRPFSTHAAGQD